MINYHIVIALFVAQGNVANFISERYPFVAQIQYHETRYYNWIDQIRQMTSRIPKMDRCVSINNIRLHIFSRDQAYLAYNEIILSNICMSLFLILLILIYKFHK